MNSATITRADFVTLVRVLDAFLKNERPVPLVLAAADLYKKLGPQAVRLETPGR